MTAEAIIAGLATPPSRPRPFDTLTGTDFAVRLYKAVEARDQAETQRLIGFLDGLFKFSRRELTYKATKATSPIARRIGADVETKLNAFLTGGK